MGKLNQREKAFRFKAVIGPCRNLGRSKIPMGERSLEKVSVEGLVSGSLDADHVVSPFAGHVLWDLNKRRSGMRCNRANTILHKLSQCDCRN